MTPVPCDHSLGFLSDMQTIATDRDYYYRKCAVCGQEERLPRANKVWGGISIKSEGKKDFERREFAKDLLQPKDKRGRIDELYNHAWGDPYQKSKIGSQVDQYRIKEKKKK